MAPPIHSAYTHPMQQTILAVVRPQLNLSRPTNQVAHVIEHILLSPERLTSLGITDMMRKGFVISADGHTSEFMCIEYYTVDTAHVTDARSALSNGSTFVLSDGSQFVNAAAVVRRELAERRPQGVSISELWEKSIYTQDSPTNAQPFHDPSGLEALSLSALSKIYSEDGAPSYMVELSYDAAVVPDITLTRNKLRSDVRRLELSHPNQSPESVDVDILIPYSATPDTYPALVVLLRLLSDADFGLLSRSLRHEHALVYETSAVYRYTAEHLGINFSCAPATVDEAIRLTMDCLSNLAHAPDNEFREAAQRAATAVELDWGNIQASALTWLSEYLFIGIKQTPKQLADAIRSASRADVEAVWSEICEANVSRSLTTVLRNGLSPAAVPL